ncbi:MAG: heparin lyase I family protein [Flavobacteriaceae bacterium]
MGPISGRMVLTLIIGGTLLMPMNILNTCDSSKRVFEKTSTDNSQENGDGEVGYQAEVPNPDTPCAMYEGRAGDTGLKVWCWDTMEIPAFSKAYGVKLGEKGGIRIDSECYEEQVFIVGDRLRFRVNPTEPKIGDWCNRPFHMRAEVRTVPWNIRHEKGTEEWFGWRYTLGDDYKIDQENEWLFFQVHPGVTGLSPQVELMVINTHQYQGGNAGEIYVVNKGNYPDNHATGIVPKAGESLDIVVHAIWGDAANGLLQVWINDEKVYDKQVATVYADYPWGGNAKWGIYKWPWLKENRVQKSLDQNITHLETFMGPLRILTRRPGDKEYGKDAYSLVAPR